MSPGVQRWGISARYTYHLLQIVGDPAALVKDENWRALLAYCIKENAYRGCPCPMLGADKDSDALGDVDSMVRRFR